MQHKTNITKRLLSVLLALIVVVGLLPAQPALAANMIDCYWRGTKFTNSSGAVLADEDGYYLADGISLVDWTFEAEKEYAAGDVYASHFSVSEYSENPRAYLFANEGCTVPFQTVPVSGNTYYVRFQCLIHNSHGDITLYQRLNDSNTTLAIPGCTTTFVNSRHIRHWDLRDSENRVTDIFWVYELTFRVTQGYTLEEVTASAAGVSMETTGKVRLKEYQYDLTWHGGYAPSCGYVYPYLYTDPECTQTLSKMPEPDGKYYVPLTFYNTQANDTTINFNLISQATLNIPDFSVSKKSIRTFRYLSQDRVEIIFEVQRDPYVIEKVEANAKQLKKDSKGTYYFSNCLATLTWKDGNSSSYQFNGVAYLYRDEECLNNPFYMELRPNESGYASLVIRNAVAGNHGIDFSQISPDSTLSLLPGYTATFVKSVPYLGTDGMDEVCVIFRVTRGDEYILRRIDATSTGVKKYSDGTPYLDGLSYTFTWKDNKSPALFGDDYGAPMFYTDADCTNQVTTDLTVGTNYYVPLTFYNPVEYDHSIDFSQIWSLSTLTIPGCRAAFYKIIPFVDSEHCDSVKVVFQVTKLPPPAAEYVLEKYEMTAEGVEGGYGSSYSLDGEVETLTWKNGKVTSNILTNGNVNLYTDEACTNSLETRPTLGQSCYARIILCNKTKNDHSIDFSQISSATLTIPLYDVILHSVETYEETNNRDAVRIIFKLTKHPYTLEKITPTATGVAQRNGANYYLSGYSTSLVWKDDVVPPRDFYPLDDDNYLYIDEDCYTRLTTEPEAGTSYYVRCGVWHWNDTEYDYSIDMDRISETTTLTLPGYSVAFHKVGLYEDASSGRVERFIIFKVSFHALERIDVTATGVNYYGGGINALDGCRVKYTWANGALPFGFSSDSEIYVGDFLCIDEDCTTSLEGEARDGETYYWSFRTGARVDNDHSIDFSKISPDSTLTVPGYTATFHKSETYVSTYSNCSMVRVIFKLTKDGGTPGDVTYTVTFKDGENVISTATVNSGEKVAKPVDPSKSGYSFDGWYEDPTFNIVFDFDQPITANASVYAKFSPITVTGISIATPGKTVYTVGDALDVSGMDIKVDYSDGTSTTIPVTATMVSGFDSSAPAASQTLTITYEGKTTTYDVSFKASSVTPPGPVTVPEVKQQGTEEPVQQPTKEEKAVISMNAGLKISQTGSKINIKWGKVGEADGYDVYVAYCDKKFGKAVKTINKNSTTSVTVKKINGKKINLKKNFKVYVAAYKMTDGKKEVLAKSIMGHVVGRLNTRYSNVRKITLSKSKYSVKVGKTVKVKAKTVLVDKSKKQLSNAHAAEFRYASSNRNIATVHKNGKVKGVAKGTCIIYVYARNGYAKTVKVTVK